jgi:hypothetical protein
MKGTKRIMAAEPRLEHQTFKVKQLVEDYRTGRIVIPEFQREYVWRRSKAPRLIDSLYRGFPISSFLLWQSTEGTRARRVDPRPQRSTLMNWLIDGQQRIITLSRTMNGDEGIDVVFHPDQDEFRLANVATRQDPNWFHVSDLWDDNVYRKLRRNLDVSRNAERWEARFDAVRRILDYEIPVVRMVDHSFDDAVDAFTRINTLGVRLKAEDIESAKIAAHHSGFIADEVAPFLRSLHQQGFRRLNVMHLFRACAFVATPDGRNRTPLHEMKRHEVLSAWKTTEKATEKAMGVIRGELGLVNMDILWSGALVVPLIAICATMPPRELGPKELAGWLSLAALCHRYSGSSETALDQDLRACRDPDPIGSLLTNLRNVRSLIAVPKDFSGALADRGGLLALYVACMNRGILDFYTGGKVLLQGNVDQHHILPRAQFPEKRRSTADIIANMAFITGPVNKAIGQTGPEVYLKTIKPRILKSQCIPTDSALWRIDQAESFWRVRRGLLADSFNEYIRKSLPQRRF